MTRPFVARGASFEEALERIAHAGYRHLHFGPNDRRADGTSAVPEGATPEQLAALATLCARHDLAPISMFPRHGGELAADTLEAFRTDVDTARALGVRTLIMWGPWPYRQGLVVRHARAEVRSRHEAWFTAMADLAAHAEGQGVMITLKPHTGLTATSWELQDTLARINSAAVRACYDGGNVHYYEGLAPEEDIKEIAAQTAALCVKDHRGPRGHEDFPTPGDGEVDHRSMLTTLRAAGFSGPCLVELVGGSTPEETEHEARRALAHVQDSIVPPAAGGAGAGGRLPR
jgi:sugar phosphate isomerase/epimerase